MMMSNIIRCVVLALRYTLYFIANAYIKLLNPFRHPKMWFHNKKKTKPLATYIKYTYHDLRKIQILY